jgi:hypothetical protein
MTQQYLAGEFSLLLAQLQAVARDPSSGRALAVLRREVESSPPEALAVELTRALEITDELCFDSLTRGDMNAFDCEAATIAQLREFGVCARLLDDS